MQATDCDIHTGAMEFILIAFGAHSTASVFVRFSTPALAAPECLWEDRVGKQL